MPGTTSLVAAELPGSERRTAGNPFREPPATYRIHTAASGATVLTVTGRLDYVAMPELRYQLLTVITSSRIVVDLSSTESVDSSSLGALIAGLKAARVKGGDLRIAHPNKMMRMMLERSRLDEVLLVLDDVDEDF